MAEQQRCWGAGTPQLPLPEAVMDGTHTSATEHEPSPVYLSPGVRFTAASLSIAGT